LPGADRQEYKDNVTGSRVIAFEDLGAEAIRRLTVQDFPVTVVIDSRGENLYRDGPHGYLQYRP
jgi:fumarate hydratase subunit beta